MTCRATLKRLVAGMSLAFVSPLIALARLGSVLSGDDALFVSVGCLLSLVPGQVGSLLRVGYLRGTLSGMGQDVRIGFGSFFSKRAAKVSSGVFIGAYCILGRVTIGEGVIIASRVSITSGRHQHGDQSRGVVVGSSRFSDVVIGDGCWIGEGAIVAANVGAGSIVGAGSVVVSDLPARVVAVGNPARVRPEPASSAGHRAALDEDIDIPQPLGLRR